MYFDGVAFPMVSSPLRGRTKSVLPVLRPAWGRAVVGAGGAGAGAAAAAAAAEGCKVLRTGQLLLVSRFTRRLSQNSPLYL